MFKSLLRTLHRVHYNNYVKLTKWFFTWIFFHSLSVILLQVEILITIKCKNVYWKYSLCYQFVIMFTYFRRTCIIFYYVCIFLYRRCDVVYNRNKTTTTTKGKWPMATDSHNTMELVQIRPQWINSSGPSSLFHSIILIPLNNVYSTTTYRSSSPE